MMMAGRGMGPGMGPMGPMDMNPAIMYPTPAGAANRLPPLMYTPGSPAHGPYVDDDKVPEWAKPMTPYAPRHSLYS